MWRNRLWLEMINIQHTSSKNVVQLFAERLEVVLVGTALKVIETKAVAMFIPHCSGVFSSKDDTYLSSESASGSTQMNNLCVRASVWIASVHFNGRLKNGQFPVWCRYLRNRILSPSIWKLGTYHNIKIKFKNFFFFFIKDSIRI